MPAAKIDTVLFTHLHSDHIGDLGEVGMQSWIGGRTTPLEAYGPPAPDAYTLPKDAEGETFGTSGTEQVVKGFAQAYNADGAFRIVHHLTRYMPPEGARMIGHDIPSPGRKRTVTVYDKDGLKIQAFLVAHDPAEPAYGYRIDYKGRAAVISGDTHKVQNMVALCRGADVLVHEALNARMVEMVAASLEQDGKTRQAKMTRDTIDYHTTPAEAAGIADEAGVPFLVLTHLVPPLPNALMRHMFLEDVRRARGPGGPCWRGTCSSSRCPWARRTSRRRACFRSSCALWLAARLERLVDKGRRRRHLDDDEAAVDRHVAGIAGGGQPLIRVDEFRAVLGGDGLR